MDKYSYHGISSACVYGGGNRSEQVQQVRGGVDIVVATPGRLNDLIEANILNLDDCSYLILDEADRMLDMGFEPQIKKVRYSVEMFEKRCFKNFKLEPGFLGCNIPPKFPHNYVF